MTVLDPVNFSVSFKIDFFDLVPKLIVKVFVDLCISKNSIFKILRNRFVVFYFFMDDCILIAGRCLISWCVIPDFWIVIKVLLAAHTR